MTLASLRVTLLTVLGLAATSVAHAGAFISATESSPDRITHPSGYNGSGGTLSVDVCIDSSAPNAADMVTPLENAIAIWNDLEVHTGNLVFGAQGIPAGRIDFESVLLHELGHCIGLAHSNLASESGLPTASQDYAKSADGPSNSFDLSSGTDGLKSTGDDQRGDDVNLIWYENGSNNPFVINSAVVDSTTYSRTLTSLPSGDTFAATAERNNSSSFGAGFTEAVMNQGTLSSEEQRLLTADDVSALRYAQSGLDSIAGTSDDYTLELNYGGSMPSPSCDINVSFDNTKSGFAVCQASTQRIGNFFSNDYRIVAANVYFNTGFSWFFNTETCGNGALEGTEQCDDGNFDTGDGCNQTCGVENLWTCSGEPSVCNRICGDGFVGPEACDDGGTAPGDGCSATCEVETGWSCLGAPSVCTAACGDGFIVGGEACDDSGVSPGDGCDPTCQVEAGWTCSGEPSTCSLACGDGLVSSGETCDDGGTTGGDGCDAVCQVETGWTCAGEPSTCSPPSVSLLGAFGRFALVATLIAVASVRRRRWGAPSRPG